MFCWYTTWSEMLHGILQQDPRGWFGPQAQFGGTCTMAITIQIPAVLRSYCNGATELPLSAATVRAALEQIEHSHPALYRNICDESGAVRRHVGLFVNTSHMRDCNGLDTALVNGDVVTIMPAVSGG